MKKKIFVILGMVAGLAVIAILGLLNIMASLSGPNGVTVFELLKTLKR